MDKLVDDALAALTGLDEAARAVAQEVKDALEAVHRAGLVTIVQRMRAYEATRAVLFDLVDDPVVHMLLSLHEIVRPDPMTHANRVLVTVRPQLQSHGGDVTLVRIEDGIAFVRLDGACNGCSMSSVTLRHLVESALVEGVPSITGVEVLPNEPSPTLIPLESLRMGLDPDAEGWVKDRLAHAAGRRRGVTTLLQLALDGRLQQLVAHHDEGVNHGGRAVLRVLRHAASYLTPRAVATGRITT